MADGLGGKRVLVLRPAGQAAALVTLLERHGATAIAVPAIEIAPPERWDEIDAALARPFDVGVFTSVNGVAVVLGRAEQTGAELRARTVVAIGPATAAALRAHGVGVDLIPNAYTTEAVAETLPGPGGSVCLFRADLADERLDQRLRARGFVVTRVQAYRTLRTDPRPIADALCDVDAVVLTSASIARAFAAAATPAARGAVRVVAIGPVTAAAAAEAGLEVHAQAREHTVGGILETLDALLTSAR